MRITKGGRAITTTKISREKRRDVKINSLREGKVFLEAVIEISLTSFLLLLIQKESLCNISINATF